MCFLLKKKRAGSERLVFISNKNIINQHSLNQANDIPFQPFQCLWNEVKTRPDKGVSEMRMTENFETDERD